MHFKCGYVVRGMGPVNPPQSWAGKLFAGLFALYAGLVFIVAAALLLLLRYYTVFCIIFIGMSANLEGVAYLLLAIRVC